MMQRLWHLASFRTDDPHEAVAASFSCQVCLGSAAAVSVVGEADDDPVGFARCSDCGRVTEVILTRDQTWRLAVAPPPMAAVHFVS